MPVARVRGRECPDQTAPGEPRLDVGVRGDVIAVVVVDEIIVGDRPIEDESHQGKTDADRGRRLSGESPRP